MHAGEETDLAEEVGSGLPLSAIAGGGELGQLMRSHDWSDSPLGPPENWPASLRTVVDLMLGSQFPMFVAWGEELGFLYNDAYARILGAKHPAALGGRFRQIWSEIWPDIWPLIDAAMSGQATYRENLPLLVNRQGFEEQAWFTFSYSPVRDDHGVVAGMFCAVAETTEQMLAEKQIRESEARFRGVFNSRLAGFTIFDANTGNTLAVNDTFLRMTGHTRADFDQGRWDWREFTLPEDLPLDEAAIEQARAKGFWDPYEKHYLRRDGTRFAARVASAALPEEFGRVVVSIEDITEKRAAQETIAASEALARTRADELDGIYNAAPVGLCVLDRELRYLRINDRLAEINGAPAAEHIGRSVAEIVPDLSDQALAAMRRVLQGEEIWNIELSGTTAAQPGVMRTWRENWLPLRDESGEIAGVMISAEEITEAKRAQAALEESETRFRGIADGAPVMMWVTDPSGFCTYLNKPWYEFTGQGTGAGEGYGWLEAVHPEDRSAAEAAFVGANAERRQYRIDFRLRRADGIYRWVLDAAAPRFSSNGEYLGYVGSVIDIEDRKELEAALERGVAERTRELSQSKQRFQGIFDSALQFMALLTPDGTVVEVNRTALAWSQIEASDIVGKPFWLAAPMRENPELQEAVRQGIARAAAGQTVRAEYDMRGAGEVRATIDFSLKPVLSETGDPVYLVAEGRDITALKQAQEALRQSQKMEAMGQLTGGVAHDFNNLLTPIIGSLDMLTRRGVGSEREQRLIGGALQSAERAKTLVQRLLAFARRQPLQARAVDLSQLVNGIAGLIGSTIGPNVQVRVELAEDLPPVRADANQLEMALLNLAVNSRDAMRDGGVLTISAAPETIRRGHRSQMKEGRCVRLSVADTGRGMDDVTLARAVEPFFSTKGIGQGTGLGLSMVHGLAAQLGGALTIESSPGAGATVDLWLPISAEPMVEDPVKRDDAPVRSRGLALIVDDEELVRMTTADMLNDLGYEVVEAGSGEEALRLFDAAAPPDLLVTDHLMPGMTGVELIRALRLIKADLPALIVSGYADADAIAPDLPRLTKPFRNAELAERLAELRLIGAPED